MQDLPRGGATIFLGEGACDALRSHAFARGVWGHASPKNFWKWCVLEHIFIIFLLSKVCPQSTDNIY